MADGNLGFDVNPGGTRLVIGQVVFLGLAWIVCILRAHVKVSMIRKISLDDWLMLAALLIYTAYGVIDIHGVVMGGTGKHTKELSLDGIAVALRAWYLCEVLNAPLSALIRTSIALFLLRLVVNPWHIWVIRINLGIIWLTSIIYFFLMTLQCLPPSFFWEGPALVPGVAGTCIDHNVVPLATIVYSVLSAISDWILGLLPIAMLWNVSINARTKASIAVLLSMGLIAGAALIVRIPYVKKIAISADFLFETIDIAIWSVIEPSLGIMAGCIAAIRPLFKNFGFGLNRTKRYDSGQPGFGLQRRRFPSNMKKLDDASLGVQPNSSPSQMELRQSENNSANNAERHPRGVTCAVECGNHEAFESVDRINVHTSIDVVSYRQSSIAAGSEDSLGERAFCHPHILADS
ncbi:integral membrane protein [Xylariales sp. AK1849]|nr:integral membrane protein [Xylariales sp. AK1849]